ncbi:MAG: ABC transporter permease [Candidatus Woesearchaeota archaeon]
MISDYFRFAVDGILSRKMRSWLTMLGIFVGIAAVVALISMGQGMQNAITEQFERVGSNRILIVPGSRFMGPGGSGLVTAKLTEKDWDVVKDVRGVDVSLATFSKTVQIQFEDELKYASVQGYPVSSETEKVVSSTSFLDIEDGRQLKQGDGYAAVLGNAVAYDHFKSDIRAGDTILIKGVEFGVVGVQKKAGTGVHDIIVRIPLEKAREIFQEETEVSMVMVLVKKGFEAQDVALEIRKALRKSRDVKEDEEDFSVQTAQQTVRSFLVILDVVQAVLVGIAAISLVVGGIGIMNTMYTSVLERTREIGIMKAIGARNSDIMWIFLIESGLLGVVGGVIGLVLGLSMSISVQAIAVQFGVPSLKAYVSPILVLGAVGFSFMIGSLSGVLPALQAAKMNPVDALRKYA